FIDPKYPKKVYKVVKALYGLHQAPRAWYATLSTFLLKNGYRRGTIDKTLFIKKDKHDIILVQVYVDDIIFGSTKKSWCDEFEALMKSRFQMSSMGELTFFLGLQVKQKEDGIFISQDKYVAEILKKFDFVSVKTASTPIETQKPLVKDEEASDVDVHLYRSMIGSLMYLTASRPDIMFAVCACSRFQVTPKTSHLSAVKRIFRYLKGKPKLGLWYPRVSSFDLEAYSDSDYAGANLVRKSATGGCQFLGRRLISWQCKKQTIVATSTTEAEYVAAANCFKLQLLGRAVLFSVCDVLIICISASCSATSRLVEIMERKSVIARLNKVSSPDGDYLVIYRANRNFRAFNCLLEVLHIFDRQYLFHLYDLVMEQYSEITLEGIELILWGDLKIMMESSQEENDQKLKDGTVIHMLVERRYPLSKDLLQRMLDLGLEVERETLLSSNPSKKIKLTIIPPRQLFVNISSDEDVITTPSPITTSSSPSLPNAPSKTPSTKDTSSTFGTTSYSFKLKTQSSPPTSNDTPSPQPSNPFLENVMDAPPRPSHPLPLQSHPSLDITLSLSPITPLDHILDTPSPPSPQPQPQPPLMGHPIYFNYHDYHGSTCLCCFHNRNLIFSLRDEMNLMFAHIEYLLTSTMTSLSPPHP
ncbi:putative ribonuclease H-like domain-containing protein, partial [Tanacetum coccineum]